MIDPIPDKNNSPRPWSGAISPEDEDRYEPKHKYLIGSLAGQSLSHSWKFTRGGRGIS